MRLEAIREVVRGLRKAREARGESHASEINWEGLGVEL